MLTFLIAVKEINELLQVAMSSLLKQVKWQVMTTQQDWLSSLPDGHVVDCVIGHGAILGRQVQVIKRHCNCKWIQVVHTTPEELGMFKSHTGGISTERREKAPGRGITL